MQRWVAGFLGGVIGGFIKLVLDQATFAINLSSVDTISTLSWFLFPAGGVNYTAGWIIYILATGVAGWIVSNLFSKEFPREYFSSGLLLGVILWGVMNTVFAITGVTTPTWALGVSSLVVNMITHLVLGVAITYILWKNKVMVGR